MKKYSTSEPKKQITKGKSLSIIQPNQQSRATNKSNDPRKFDNKIQNIKGSKVTKTNSCIKIHQPLSIQNRGVFKQSKQSTKIQSVQQSRKKIQSHLDKKQSYSDALYFKQPVVTQVRTRESMPNQEQTVRLVNDKLEKQNKQLKQKYLRMQQISLQDKQKIKTLITRISQVKRENTNKKGVQNSEPQNRALSKPTLSYTNLLNPIGQTPFHMLQPSNHTYTKQKDLCHNQQCQERKKYLQSQLYKERIKRDQLQEKTKEYQRNKQGMKRQYEEIVREIQNIRQNDRDD